MVGALILVGFRLPHPTAVPVAVRLAVVVVLEVVSLVVVVVPVVVSLIGLILGCFVCCVNFSGFPVLSVVYLGFVHGVSH